MSALAIPINELIPFVDQAREATECVAERSRSGSADLATTLNIAYRVCFTVNYRLRKVARRQDKIITSLVHADFSAAPANKIRQLADSTAGLVQSNRDLLKDAYRLGAEIRVWWDSSLQKLADQTEHLDSIAESLYVASDVETSTLLGIAVGHFAEQPAAAAAVAGKTNVGHVAIK